MPPPKSIAAVLQASPLLSTEEAKILFPTKAEQDQLLELAKAVHASVDKNQAAAETWKALTQYKDVAIKLLRKAIGVPF